MSNAATAHAVEVVGGINAIVEQQKAEAAAERRVLSTLQRINPPKRYRIRSLALMTLSQAAMIADAGSR